MAGLRVHVVMPAELVERIDAALMNGGSRGDFVRRAVERALGGERERDGVPVVEANSPKKRAAGQQSDHATDPQPSPAPAEQPGAVEQASVTGVGGGSPGVSKAGLPAPAEQPGKVAGSYRQHVPGPDVENVRSSAQSKRGVVPVPKGRQ